MSDMAELFARDPLKHTREQILDGLDYDPYTGVFTWVKTNQGHKAGEPAGSITRDGYISIRIKGKAYQAHRLAWLVMCGVFPDGPLDHIDCDRENNKFENLRKVTPQQNSLNRKKKTEGVRLDPRNKFKPWRANGWKDNKEHYIGAFASREEACTAYTNWRMENINV